MDNMPALPQKKTVLAKHIIDTCRDCIPENRTLVLDFETSSVEDIKICGSTKYLTSKHKILMGRCFDLEKLNMGFQHYLTYGGKFHPVENYSREDKCKNFVVFNAYFEAKVIGSLDDLRQTLNFIDLSIFTSICNIGGSLSNSTSFIGIKLKKLQIKFMPYTDKELHLDDHLKLETYCDRDVELTTLLYLSLFKVIQDNKYLIVENNWDIFFSHFGIKIDLVKLEVLKVDAKKLEESNNQFVKEFSIQYFGTLVTANHRIKLRKFLNATISKGLKSNDFNGNTDLLLNDVSGESLQNLITYLPKSISFYLSLRKYLKALLYTISTSSLKKITKIENYLIKDRIFDYTRFCKTNTQRWSGSGVQIQNFPRSGGDNLTSQLRSLLIPTFDTFVKIDFKQIESRIIAWVTQDNNLLNSYNRNRDIYLEIGKKIQEFIYIENDEVRRVGKIAVLSCGYGIGATQLSKTHNISYRHAEVIINTFKTYFPSIPKHWRLISRMLRCFILMGFSESQTCTEHDIIYKFQRTRINTIPVVKINLSFTKTNNSYNLYYPFLCFDPNERKFNYNSNKIVKRLTSPSLFNHIIQLLARQILAGLYLKFCSLYKNRGDGFCIAFTLHDEIVLDIKDKYLPDVLETLKDYESNNFINKNFISAPLLTEYEVLKAYK